MAFVLQFDPESSGSRIERLQISGGELYTLFFQTDREQVGNPNGMGASNIVVSDSLLHDSGGDFVKISPKCNDIRIGRSEIYRSGQIYLAATSLDHKNAEGIVAGSAAINAGTALAKVPDDIDSQVRIGTLDLGADELAEGIYRNGFE